jgi:hypothetical protein
VRTLINSHRSAWTAQLLGSQRRPSPANLFFCNLQASSSAYFHFSYICLDSHQSEFFDCSHRALIRLNTQRCMPSLLVFTKQKPLISTPVGFSIRQSDVDLDQLVSNSTAEVVGSWSVRSKVSCSRVVGDVLADCKLRCP